MPQKYKLNLYQVQVPRKNLIITHHKREYKILKFTLITALAFTVLATINQSISSINTKPSFADFNNISIKSSLIK